MTIKETEPDPAPFADADGDTDANHEPAREEDDLLLSGWFARA